MSNLTFPPYLCQTQGVLKTAQIFSLKLKISTNSFYAREINIVFNSQIRRLLATIFLLLMNEILLAQVGWLMFQDFRLNRWVIFGAHYFHGQPPQTKIFICHKNVKLKRQNGNFVSFWRAICARNNHFSLQLGCEKKKRALEIGTKFQTQTLKLLQSDLSLLLVIS